MGCLSTGTSVERLWAGGCVNTVGPSTYCQPGVNCFQTNVTPEPVTLALVGTGLGLVGLVRRRRGKHGTLEKT